MHGHGQQPGGLPERDSMKVIIAGSRTITDPAVLDEGLKQLAQAGWHITEVVSGGAHGADILGEQWAEEAGMPVRQFLPDWEEHGRSAGFRRNAEMAVYAHAALVLWDGVSRGARSMIDLMQGRGKPVIVIRTEEEKP